MPSLTPRSLALLKFVLLCLISKKLVQYKYRQLYIVYSRVGQLSQFRSKIDKFVLLPKLNKLCIFLNRTYLEIIQHINRFVYLLVLCHKTLIVFKKNIMFLIYIRLRLLFVLCTDSKSTKKLIGVLMYSKIKLRKQRKEGFNRGLNKSLICLLVGLLSTSTNQPGLVCCLIRLCSKPLELAGLEQAQCKPPYTVA